MSSLRDILGFERFHLRDIGKKIKKDPERLLLGAVDPFATRIWNQTGVGKDWEPIVDQMGGAYGGSALTLGDTGEGVYGRAREAGVPTEAGAGMHDIAHVIASLFAGNYAAGKMPGGQMPSIPGGGMKGNSSQPPAPIPFMSSQPRGSLPVGDQTLSQLLSQRKKQQLLAALLRSRNG